MELLRWFERRAFSITTASRSAPTHRALYPGFKLVILILSFSSYDLGFLLLFHHHHHHYHLFFSLSLSLLVYSDKQRIGSVGRGGEKKSRSAIFFLRLLSPLGYISHQFLSSSIGRFFLHFHPFLTLADNTLTIIISLVYTANNWWNRRHKPSTYLLCIIRSIQNTSDGCHPNNGVQEKKNENERGHFLLGLVTVAIYY